MKRKISLAIFVASLLFCLSFAFAVNAETNDNVAFKAILSYTQTEYNGSVQKPDVIVTDGTENVLNKSEYSVTYSNSNSADAGEYTVTVTGVSNEFEQTLSYKIMPKSIRTGVDITPEYRMAAYLGKPLQPKVTAVFNGKTLVEGKDYVISYRHNNTTGNAYIDVNGINNFNNVWITGFSIIPGQVENLRCTEKTNSTIKLNWNRVEGADGYQIYVYDLNKKNYVPLKTIEGGNYMGNTLRNLTYATPFQYRVRAYADFNNVRYYGDWSAVCYTYTSIPKYTGKIKLSRPNNSDYIDVSYDRAQGCSGYEICLSHDANYKQYTYYHTNYGNSNIRKRIYGVSRNKAYYVKIRLFTKSGNDIYYGPWSNSVLDYQYNGKVTVNKAANSNIMKVSFPKSVYGQGYQIAYSRNYSFSDASYVNLYGINNTSTTISNIRRDKGYFVRVRIIYQLGNGWTYGPWTRIYHSGYNFVYATYSSNYVNNKDRTTNLKVASNAINGIVINPGETFDFNKIVGPRTAKRGYKKATVFTGTKGTAQELGGGICQVSSTIFNTALYGNVKITERHQHSQKVTYVPYGRDAAISGSNKNFRWTNNTDFQIRVMMNVSNGKITCTFMTFDQQNPGNISLKVTKSGNKYTLKRYQGNSCNYTTTSSY